MPSDKPELHYLLLLIVLLIVTVLSTFQMWAIAELGWRMDALEDHVDYIEKRP